MIDDKVAKKRLIEFQKVAYEIKMKYRRSLFGKKTQVFLKINQKIKMSILEEMNILTHLL